MGINFKKISEEDYIEINDSILFENKLSNRVFGVVSFENIRYKFSWQSDIIKPEINNIHDRVYSIGIDLNYVVLDFKTNKILLNIDLDVFFVKSLIRDNVIYVIAETQIYLISIENFNIIKSVDLPDIFDDIVFEENATIVKCFDGETVCI